MQRETPIGTWLREKRGPDTLEETAHAIGVTRRAYEAWEYGEAVPTAKHLVTIARIRSADLEEIVRLAAESARTKAA